MDGNQITTRVASKHAIGTTGANKIGVSRNESQIVRTARVSFCVYVGHSEATLALCNCEPVSNHMIFQVIHAPCSVGRFISSIAQTHKGTVSTSGRHLVQRRGRDNLKGAQRERKSRLTTHAQQNIKLALVMLTSP